MQDSNRKELQPADLHYNLDFEICRLITDGMYKIIKSKSPDTNDFEIVSDLLGASYLVFRKYEI